MINPQLNESFDSISKGIKDFYYGRYDVKANSLTDLYEGKVKIMEVNGVNSEPAHIYGPKVKLFRAYKDLFHYWRTLGRIGLANKRQGVEVDSFWLMMRELLNNRF